MRSVFGEEPKKVGVALDDPELTQFIGSQAMSNRDDVAGAALRALEKDFGDRGADLLIKFADSAQPRSRNKFNQSLNNMRSRTDLSPATQALLELRAAVKCEQKRAALLRVKQFGDSRCLTLVYALQTPTGCSPFGLGDCWACLRQSTDIEDTIKAVTGRSGAPAEAPAAGGDDSAQQ